MTTAIDSSALLAIFGDESDGAAWLEILLQARRQGRLIVCDVVYAEVTPAFDSDRDLDAALGKLGVEFEPITPASAWQAGSTFRAYRRAGGPREHLIPDFLIAAHARVQADRLAAADRGYYRRYFADLPLLKP